MRLTLLSLCALALNAQQHWTYVPQDFQTLVSMEWRRVLNSRQREFFRREIPPAGSPLLGGINFIDGIERAVLTVSEDSTLIVLHGKFDLPRLQEMAVADGAVAKPYGKAVILTSKDEDDDEGAELALVNDTIVLLGDRNSLLEAMDRGLAVKQPAAAPAEPPADLWIVEKQPRIEIERFDLEMFIRDGVHVDARLMMASPAWAERVASNARALELNAAKNDKEVRIAGTFTGAALARRAGRWRASLQELPSLNLRPPDPPPPAGPQKVRIYGLEGGTKEIDLGPSRK